MKDAKQFTTEDIANLFTPGAHCPLGCQTSDVPAMISYCRHLSPKKYCTVRGWQLWTLQAQPLRQIVYADCLLDDEAGRFPSGYWVRTTEVISIYENCICETPNTLYILVGEGTTKEVAPELALSFF